MLQKNSLTHSYLFCLKIPVSVIRSAIIRTPTSIHLRYLFFYFFATLKLSLTLPKIDCVSTISQKCPTTQYSLISGDAQNRLCARASEIVCVKLIEILLYTNNEVH